MTKTLFLMVASVVVILAARDPVAGMLALIAALWLYALVVLESPGGIALSAIMALVVTITLGIAYLGFAEGRGRCCEVVEMVESLT